jgi:hypothetical protein
MANNSYQISACRICKSSNLESILDFGEISFTGIFQLQGSLVPKAQLHLGRCVSCGLVQLLNSYDQKVLYGNSYGYESHLNSTMAEHLRTKASVLEARFRNSETRVSEKFIALDIASNDGTLLQGYSKDVIKIGIDPLIDIVKDCYPDGAFKIKSFFSSEVLFDVMSEKVDLVTSLSVIYDLEDPLSFAKDVASVLKEGGVWHLEQSYLPSMCSTLSYDTICHEHLLYLSLHDISEILTKANFQIVDVTLNDVNGGSIAVTAIKTEKPQRTDPFVQFLLAKEKLEGYRNGLALQKFAVRASQHRDQLSKLVRSYREDGYLIYGLGASTKGNVLLQWANIGVEEILCIGDINPNKAGKCTPGSNIPIVSEAEVLEKSGEGKMFVILPWHFRSHILKKCTRAISSGSKFLIPLPEIEVVSS